MAVIIPKRSVTCPVCEKDALSASADGTDVDIFCRHCGDFTITIEFFKDFRGDVAAEELAGFVSAATRQASEAGRPLTLTDKNWRDLVATHRSVSISKKVESVLRFFAAKCGYPSSIKSFDFSYIYPVADCRDSHEFRQYVEYLIERKLLTEFYSDDGQSVVGYAPQSRVGKPSSLRWRQAVNQAAASWQCPSVKNSMKRTRSELNRRLSLVA